MWAVKPASLCGWTCAMAFSSPSPPLKTRVSACITPVLQSWRWNRAVPLERSPPGLEGLTWPHVSCTAGSGRVDKMMLGSTQPLPSPGTRLSCITRRECGQGTAGGGLPLLSSAQKMRRHWTSGAGQTSGQRPGSGPGQPQNQKAGPGPASFNSAKLSARLAALFGVSLRPHPSPAP